MGCGCKDKVNKELLEKRFDKLRETSGSVVFDDALTSFLYELMRDHLSTGTVEQLVVNATNNTDILFTNGWLAKYANNLAEELTNAKTNNLKEILLGPHKEEQVDNKKIIDGLVQSGQLKPEEAEEMKKELDELEEHNIKE
jgi:polyhydroxyalkanoate synthesis regulator phasin